MKTIHWVKWEFPLNNIQPPLLSDEQYDKFDDMNEEEPIVDQSHLPTNFIYTNFGLIPSTNVNKIYDDFNFYIGHTSFDIDDKVIDIINNTEGVEILEVFSRYRFRVSIAKNPVFDVEHVLSNIEKQLCNENTVISDNINNKVNNETIQNNILVENTIALFKRKKYKKWLVYVMPNYEVFAYNTVDEQDKKFDKKLNFYQKLQQHIGGNLEFSNGI